MGAVDRDLTRKEEGVERCQEAVKERYRKVKHIETDVNKSVKLAGSSSDDDPKDEVDETFKPDIKRPKTAKKDNISVMSPGLAAVLDRNQISIDRQHLQ